MTTDSNTADCKGFPEENDGFKPCPRCGVEFKPVKIQVVRADPEYPHERGGARLSKIEQWRMYGRVTKYDTIQPEFCSEFCSDCLRDLYIENTFDVYGNCRKCGEFCCAHTGGCGRCEKCV